MEQFTTTFLEIARRFHDAGNALEQWKKELDESTQTTALSEIQLRAHFDEFTALVNETVAYQDQLIYFFFRDEIKWKEFLLDPEAIIEDPFFKYEKTPLTLKEANCIHMLHQYSWLQVLKKLIQLDPLKGSIVFLLPPMGEKELNEQPDYLPPCILMEANMYKGQPLFYCWSVELPKTEAMTLGDGEHLSQLYHHIQEHFDTPPELSMEEYILKMKESMRERKADGQFENVSTFGGARDKKEGHIYFLYWTEFYVFMCTLNINKLMDEIPQKIRKNNLLPYNTLFCEPENFRKFRLDFQDSNTEA